jgi:hypothetical protein
VPAAIPAECAVNEPRRAPGIDPIELPSNAARGLAHDLRCPFKAIGPSNA